MLFNAPLVLAAAVTLVAASPIELETKRTAVLPMRRSINVSSISSIVEKGKARIGKLELVKSHMCWCRLWTSVFGFTNIHAPLTDTC